MTIVIVLSVLLVIAILGLFVNGMNRLHFMEKEADVIDYVVIPGTKYKYQQGIPRFHPLVKFEVEGEVYQGELRVYPKWMSKDQRKVMILFNPRNPSDFVAKETSNSPVTGCIFVIALTIALGIAIFYHLRNN